MRTVTLGRTGIVTPKNAFGALPVQRVGIDGAVKLLRAAFDGGFRFFDTARAYSDSEEKLGRALAPVRHEIVIATKTHADSGEELEAHLDESLRLLKTDYIDIYQLHNPPACPRPDDGSGLYEALLRAREAGKIRFIGITEHRAEVAREAVESGLYDTLQFPFSYLASDADEALVRLCAERGVGFLCMKALSGGLITRADAAYAYLAQFDNALPLWGIQREAELAQFIAFSHSEPQMDDGMRALIQQERKELSGAFCRGCGYCQPCPKGIEIQNVARMRQLIRRSPSAPLLTPEWREKMERADACVSCGACKKRCPYGLDIPTLIRESLADYRTFY